MLTQAMMNFIDALSVEQEERVLRGNMEPLYPQVRLLNGLPMGRDETTSCGCLIMTAAGKGWNEASEEFGIFNLRAGYDYEHQCGLYGIAAVNNAISSRITANRVERELAKVPVDAEQRDLVCIGL